MLKILCCVKQVPDVAALRMDMETGSLIREGVELILNPLDANAVSAALEVKESCGAELTVITMGPPTAEQVLRDCLALGADRAVLVTDRAFANADTLATSYTLAAAASSLDKFDLIICGMETLDGATGQMGPQLAEQLDAAQISSVSLVLGVDETQRSITVKRAAETGIETLRASLPCLLTVDKTNYPVRIPTIKGKLAAKKAKLIVMSAADIPELDAARIGDAGSPTKVPRMFPPVLPEPGTILHEGSAAADAEMLAAILTGEGMI